MLTGASEEEDPDEIPYTLFLRNKRSGPASPLDGVQLNGN
jgi:glycogen synthase